MKKYRELERIVKGFSNHRRIEILDFLNDNPGASLTDIATILRVNFKTIAEHTRRAHHAGLIMKQNKVNIVSHILSPLGKIIFKFLRTLE